METNETYNTCPDPFCRWPNCNCYIRMAPGNNQIFSPPAAPYNFFPPSQVKTVTITVPVPEFDCELTLVSIDKNCNIEIKTQQIKPENK